MPVTLLAAYVILDFSRSLSLSPPQFYPSSSYLASSCILSFVPLDNTARSYHGSRVIARHSVISARPAVLHFFFDTNLAVYSLCTLSALSTYLGNILNSPRNHSSHSGSLAGSPCPWTSLSLVYSLQPTPTSLSGAFPRLPLPQDCLKNNLIMFASLVAHSSAWNLRIPWRIGGETSSLIWMLESWSDRSVDISGTTLRNPLVFTPSSSPCSSLSNGTPFA